MRTYADYYSLRYKSIFWGKHFLGSLHMYDKPLKRPICIFSSRRSGSTLLAQVIGAEKGINVSDQPYDLWHYNPHLQKVYHPYQSKYIDLPPDVENDFYQYTKNLLEGRIRVYTGWRLFSPDYDFVVNQLAFKILNAKYLMDWFDENFDPHMIYQIRHPIPYALSVMKLKWGCTADAFIENEAFAAAYLSPSNKNLCKQILNSGSLLQKHVLEWGLENIRPLSIMTKRDWLTISYEELVTKPIESAEALAGYLGFEDTARLSQRISQPSVSTTAASQAKIQKADPQEIVGSWMKQVDPEEAKDLMSMLNQIFDISVYSWDSPFPAAQN